MAVMTAGMATISGTVLAAYAGMMSPFAARCRRPSHRRVRSCRRLPRSSWRSSSCPRREVPATTGRLTEEHRAPGRERHRRGCREGRVGRAAPRAHRRRHAHRLHRARFAMLNGVDQLGRCGGRRLRAAALAGSRCSGAALAPVGVDGRCAVDRCRAHRSDDRHRLRHQRIRRVRPAVGGARPRLRHGGRSPLARHRPSTR